ncbi:MAG: hypothetical protein B6244_00800 [Candidatus Cloacimonetes bacterium 4572_55]|nr:MAG: hypothetical protein B6244_00800 [Candidatus Cloacimonetes bacterium 4572_55]
MSLVNGRFKSHKKRYCHENFCSRRDMHPFFVFVRYATIALVLILIAPLFAQSQTSIMNDSYTADRDTIVICDDLYIQVSDADSNLSTTAQDQLTVTVQDDNSGDIETVVLIETGDNTHIFQGSLPTAYHSVTPSDGTLQLVQTTPQGSESTISATYSGGSDQASVYYPLLQFSLVEGQPDINSCREDSVTAILYNVGQGPAYGLSLTGYFPESEYSFVQSVSVQNSAGATSTESPTINGLTFTWNPGLETSALYNIASDDSLTFIFRINVGCSHLTAIGLKGYYFNGLCSTAVDDSVGGTGPDGEFNYAVDLNRGALNIIKEAIAVNGTPIAPTSAPVAIPGDTITYRIQVENLSFGTVYNISVLDSMNVGMAYISANPAPEETHNVPTDWVRFADVDSLESDSIAEFELIAHIVECENLQNYSFANWSCDPAGPSCDPREDTNTSINLKLEIPRLDFSPSDITIPYCGVDTVTYDIINAYNARVESLYLYIDAFPPNFTITPISNILAYETNPEQRFLLPDIGENETITISYAISLNNSWCDVGAAGSIGSISYQTQYRDLCGSSYNYPTRSGNYEVGGQPEITVMRSHGFHNCF